MNANVHPFPAITPGCRLVPATIGREGATQTAWIPCPHWCVLDHEAERVTWLEDINHEGERRAMKFAPSNGAAAVPIEVFVSHWPGSEEQPMLAVDLDREVETYGRTAALALADQLVAFAVDVRRMAQTLPDDAPAPVRIMPERLSKRDARRLATKSRRRRWSA